MALTIAAKVTSLLRWGTAETTKFSTQLDDFINAATEIVEAEAGPFEPVTLTYTADGGDSVALPKRVLSVTSVTVGGTAVAAANYTVDVNAGIVYGPFASGRQNVVVTYEAGMDPVPASVEFATRSLVAHMWSVASQRGPGLPEDFTAVPTGFLVPNAVKEALAPYKAAPGFA